MENAHEDAYSDKDRMAEDASHVHAEIRQLRNHQFLLTTTALTIFGVIVAWLFQKDLSPPNTNDVGAARFAITSLLIVILFVIFLWLQRLRSVINIFATYLKKKNLSNWEVEYGEFTKKSYISQSGFSTVIFLILGAASIASVLTTAVPLHLDEHGFIAGIFTGVIFIIYCIFISGLGYGRWFYNEEGTEQRWDKILKPK